MKAKDKIDIACRIFLKKQERDALDHQIMLNLQKKKQEKDELDHQIMLNLQKKECERPSKFLKYSY